MKRFLVSCGLLLTTTCMYAQFAPQVGTTGTTAIHMDSSIWVNWASGCTLQRGWQNISDTTLGKVVVGDETYVPGKAGNGVVSLGDGGKATITFEHPIVNGTGYDFAVFENGFIDQTLAPGTAFLELAFVEVSSDGIHFVRFDATNLTDTTIQVGSFEGMFAQKINNLAGKYLGKYGTPFDLEELAGEPNLDVNHITHIRIIDVVGSIQNQYASYDGQGNKINDPWPTPFASSGFDLDAVGVIHQNVNLSLSETISTQQVSIFPNPAQANAIVQLRFFVQQNPKLTVYDMLGNSINVGTTFTEDGMTLQLSQPGIFQLVLSNGSGFITKRITVQ
ncbi:MAG: T9SS type A sorting domain-containing protein [Bacteroidota bacterium]